MRGDVIRRPRHVAARTAGQVKLLRATSISGEFSERGLRSALAGACGRQPGAARDQRNLEQNLGKCGVLPISSLRRSVMAEKFSYGQEVSLKRFYAVPSVIEVRKCVGGAEW